MSMSPALYCTCCASLVACCGGTVTSPCHEASTVIQPVETGSFCSCRSWGHPSSSSDVWASFQAERWRFLRQAFNVPQYLYVMHLFPRTQKFQNYSIFPINSPPFCTWRVSAVHPLYCVVVQMWTICKWKGVTHLVYTWGEFICKKHSQIPIFLNKKE